MALKGDLASVDLAQVFQMLSLNQKVGILGIDAERASRALHFDSRGVTLFFDENTMRERIVGQARRRGLVDEGAMQDSRAHSERTGQSVLESLVAGGYVDTEFIDQMTRIELEEDIYDIFFWRKASFEFYEGATSMPSSTDVVDDRFYFSVDTVIMEAARRIDEWAFIQQRVKSDEDVFRARDVDASQLREVEQLVFEHADGMRNVARFIDLTGLPRFQVFKTLAVLHEGGYIENVPDDELWEYGRACVEAGRSRDAIDLFELAIARGADCSAIRVEVGEVYETVEEYARAAEHFKWVAAAHVEAGEPAQAMHHLWHVVKMLPTDLVAREQLVELTVGTDFGEREGFDANAHGKELVDLYMEIDDVDRVRGILEQLLRVNPNDLALKKRLINVHTKAGDTRRVVELYESIAEDLIRQRDPIEAIKYLQKIVMIDRSRRDISERIRGLYKADERRRSRRRSLVFLGAFILLLGVVASGWYVYEQEARKQMGVVSDRVADLAGEKRFVEALAELDAFITRYPLTMVSREAGAERARIESLKGAEDELEKVRQRQLGLAREEKRKQYRAAWARYEQLAAAERLDEALEKLLAVQALVAEVGQAEDVEWSRQVNVEKNRRELEHFISEAARLDREAWKQFEAGDWQAARASWLRLVEDYDVSKTARTVRLPVLLGSRPRGAVIHLDGKPLTKDGKPVVTPAVVMCRPGIKEEFELRAPGFQTISVEIEARRSAAVEPTLRVVPRRTFTFTSPARTPVAIGRGQIAVGLRNGRFAVAVAESGEVKFDRQIEGLDEVQGLAVFAVDRVYYLTTEGYLVSRRIATGELLWRERLPGAPIHPPELHSGRLLLTDTERLHVFDPLTGKRLFSTTLGGEASGPPTVLRGKAYFGLRNGQIAVVDLTTRAVRQRSARIEDGITTRVHVIGGDLLYGNDRGEIVLRKSLSTDPIWRRKLDYTCGDEDLIVRDGAIFARSGPRSVTKLRLSDGQELGRVDLRSPIVHGLVATDSRLFLVRRVKPEKNKPYDVMQAFDLQDLELEWEFKDGGRFDAPPTSDERSLFLPNSKGEVLRFR